MSSYVCEDIVANIFERLPHKSVVRFRSLSKYWCSRLFRMHTLRSLMKNTSHQKILMRHSFSIFLEGVSFGDMFTLHTQDRLPLDFKRGYIGITGVRIPCDIRGASILGSCKGILCLKSFNTLISLWNFSVRCKAALPADPSVGATKEVPNVVFGFGYDRIAHDYNIVGISYSNDKGIPRNDLSFIYSMKRDSWSMISPPTSLFSEVRSNACFLNGKLHWLVFGATESPFIMTFSLNTRVFGTIQLPKNWKQEEGYQLTTINGSLAVIDRRDFDDTFIWLIREYDNVKSWFMFSQIQTDDINILQPFTNDKLVIYHMRKEYIYDEKIRLGTEMLTFKPYNGTVKLEKLCECSIRLDRWNPCGTTVFPSTETCETKRKFTLLNGKNVYDDCLYDDVVDDDDDDDGDGLEYDDHCCCCRC